MLSNPSSVEIANNMFPGLYVFRAASNRDVHVLFVFAKVQTNNSAAIIVEADIITTQGAEYQHPAKMTQK
jgi:hypothetical protein